MKNITKLIAIILGSFLGLWGGQNLNILNRNVYYTVRQYDACPYAAKLSKSNFQMEKELFNQNIDMYVQQAITLYTEDSDFIQKLIDNQKLITVTIDNGIDNLPRNFESLFLKALQQKIQTINIKAEPKILFVRTCCSAENKVTINLTDIRSFSL